MKVGSLVFATDQGLGYLAKDFYDNGVITDVMVVAHGKRPEHMDWYPGAEKVNSLRSQQEWRRIEEFASRMDAMWFLETPFLWHLLPFCRTRKIPTVLSVMYECEPRELPFQPSAIHSPSLLDKQYYPNSIHIPVPIPRWVQWKKRERARVFVHNAGHGGLKGRNGTRELLDAIPLVQSPVEFIIRSQEDIGVKFDVEMWSGKASHYNESGSGEHIRTGKIGKADVSTVCGTIPQERLYGSGDVFVFPERFNGLSLPLQEACASGMCVMATDRFPNNRYLHPAPLILPDRYVTGQRVARGTNVFEEAIVTPEAIAKKIDTWFDSDITQYSELGKEYGGRMSWDVLKPQYMKLLEDLVG